MILGVERECRRRVRAACGWFSDGRVSRSGESLARVLLRKVLIDSGEPSGSPRRVMPLSQEEKGMFCRGVGMLCSERGGDGEVREHLAMLMLRSAAGNWWSRWTSTVETSSGGPKALPSSKYQE